MPEHESVLLLDGATGTELGRRGVDISLPLWSARAILDAPHVLEAVHLDYLEAGADILTTCTFRTHRRSLAKAGMGHRARELTQRAVEIAQRARDAVNPQVKVVGSVAPLEDCYRPDLAPPAEECEAEHREIISNLLEAGVDGILIETQNTLREAAAAARQAMELVKHPAFWMISFCTRTDGPPNILLSGESLTDLLPSLGGAYSIGTNCVAAPAIEAEVKLLRLLVPQETRISAYANVGKASAAGEWIATDAVNPDVYAEHAARWIAAGAGIVGGCCGTTPEMIRAIAQSLGR
jgi:homocysteine S-methyltransferase